MELNLNMIFDKLANFKIKFSMETDPTIIKVSNMDLVFLTEEPTHLPGIFKYTISEFDSIRLNKKGERIEIVIKPIPKEVL